MDLTAIIFSKNRPLQLYAMLESLFRYTQLPQENVHVLFKADDDFIYPMHQVQTAFGGVSFHPEFDFHRQTIDLLQQANKKVVFFTDDDVFKEHADLEKACAVLDQHPQYFAFSLRLGKHLDFCYPLQSPQRVPSGITQEPYFVWNWKGTDWDWNYLLSVDGHIFRKEQILSAAESCGQWKSPNTFEGSMSHLHPQVPLPQMVCFTSSKVFNIPHNRVQNEVQNVHGGGSEDDLLGAWKAGKKIDIGAFAGIKNRSAHQLVPLVLIDRNEGDK